MRKVRLLLLSLALLGSALAMPVSEAAAERGCYCEIYYCLDFGNELCSQDSCCRLHCCDKSDPGCTC